MAINLLVCFKVTTIINKNRVLYNIAFYIIALKTRYEKKEYGKKFTELSFYSKNCLYVFDYFINI